MAFLIGVASLLILLLSALLKPLRKLFPFFVATGFILLVVLGLTKTPSLHSTPDPHQPRQERIAAPVYGFPASMGRMPYQVPSPYQQQLDLIAQSQGFNNHAHKVEHYRLAQLWGLPTWYGRPH